MPQAIGLFSADPSLAVLLRERCPDCLIVTDPEQGRTCRVSVIDAGAPEAAGSGAAVARVVLSHEVPSGTRRPGEIRTTRELFKQNPREYLELAMDLAEAVVLATQLEFEVGYLTQIQELISMHDAEAVSERVTRSILNILGLPRGVLLLHDPRVERYVVSFTSDPDFQPTSDFLAGIPPDLLQRALSSGGHTAVDESGKLLVIPLRADEDLIGVVRVPIPENARADDAALAQVARYVSSVVQVLGNVYLQTRSRDLAMRDDLTKAYNRRFFETYLDEEIERSRRYGSVFSIIFLDLDDLKTVNNFYGHLTGSRTLQEVAKCILGAVRGIDKVIRFGGDEFCVILPQTDFDQAAAVANRIRKAMNAETFHIEPGIDIAITASFGIATYPTHAVGKEDLIRQADQAMYRVKASTKNAVGIATVDNASRPVVP